MGRDAGYMSTFKNRKNPFPVLFIAACALLCLYVHFSLETLKVDTGLGSRAAESRLDALTRLVPLGALSLTLLYLSIRHSKGPVRVFTFALGVLFVVVSFIVAKHGFRW